MPDPPAVRMQDRDAPDALPTQDGEQTFNKSLHPRQGEEGQGDPMPNALPSPERPYLDAAKRHALTEALKERFDMSDEDADEIANVLAEQFGPNAEVNDEELDPTVRSIFYTLEAKKILSFRREEYTWETGERRRGFWWRIREDQLRKDEPADVAVELSIYESLPRSVWASRQNA